MTKKERVSVGLLNASRRKRIAAGSGTSVQDVNRVVKQYQEMAKMMKRMGSKAGAAGLKAMMGGLGGGGAGGAGLGGGMPSAGQMPEMDAEAMKKLSSGLPASMGGQMFGKGGLGGMPGLGGLPGLGGHGGKSKRKK
jgi:signal recognition particle subunit SRP54